MPLPFATLMPISAGRYYLRRCCHFARCFRCFHAAELAAFAMLPPWMPCRRFRYADAELLPCYFRILPLALLLLICCRHIFFFFARRFSPPAFDELLLLSAMRRYDAMLLRYYFHHVMPSPLRRRCRATLSLRHCYDFRLRRYRFDFH